ncbi:hypothetical protein ScPMuIL_018188 [Solemya velum]
MFVRSHPWKRSTMAYLFLATVLSLFAIGYCKNYTVTEEVWLDIQIKDMEGAGDDFTGRIVIGLFGDSCPMTTMNFAAIAKGFRRKGENLHYKNTRIHRVIPDFIIQGGDTTTGDGTGGKSIFGDKFIDENFKLSHKSTGFVSMANHGQDSNGSQFFITLNKARWLDNKHVVFGKVVKGMDVLRTIGRVPSDSKNAEPKKAVKIIDCGIVGIERPYDLTYAQTESDDDVA